MHEAAKNSFGSGDFWFCIYQIYEHFHKFLEMLCIDVLQVCLIVDVKSFSHGCRGWCVIFHSQVLHNMGGVFYN